MLRHILKPTFYRIQCEASSLAYKMAFKLITEWISSVNSLTVITIVVGLVCLAASLFFERLKFIHRVNQVPGFPGGPPLIGNTAMIVVSPDEVFNRIMGYVIANKCLGPVVRVWAGPFPIFFLTTATAFETVLGSNKLIDKSREYNFLHPWLNTGLLTSTGTKWFNRRKMLTPTFHFKILEDFLQIFNEQSQVLVRTLSKASGAHPSGFNIYPYITRCTLDIICETAMGCCIKAQTEAETDYVRAIYSMSNVIQTRQTRPWLQPDILFQFSSLAKEQRKNLEILHGFTMDVIKRRKVEYKTNRTNGSISVKAEMDDLTQKKRLAFLDLLIEASQNGKVLSDTDIREEVDTFMFEGHDTTTAAINWSLLLVGSHPNVQEQVSAELERVFGGDSDRAITMADLTELKYLECCIKEALRLYPSVPLMGRCLSEDTLIHGYTLPAKSSVLLMTYLLHRDPQNFPAPDHFQPERFFPENSQGRHPYAYVPFSAGARNCIGQKFALMEEKVILASILRNYHVEAIDKREELVLLGELILRPRDGVHLRLTRRNN